MRRLLSDPIEGLRSGPLCFSARGFSQLTCQERIVNQSRLEVHSFGAAPKAPSPFTEPEQYAAEKKRIRQAYAQAYAQYWKKKMPDNGLPVRFTVYLEELPDVDASYEFGAVALLQR